MVVIVFFRCSFFEHFQLGISIRVLSGLCSLSIFFLLFFSIRHRVLTPILLKNHSKMRKSLTIFAEILEVWAVQKYVFVTAFHPARGGGPGQGGNGSAPPPMSIKELRRKWQRKNRKRRRNQEENSEPQVASSQLLLSSRAPAQIDELFSCIIRN